MSPRPELKRETAVDFETARRKMVDCQVRPDNVTDDAVIIAFETVPREAFLPKAKQALAYSELEIETVPGRALWSARDLAKLLQAMELDSSELALVIGAGEGYSAALLNTIVETVIALDSDEAITDSASERLSKLGCDRVAVVSGPIEAGYSSEGPYDAILVNGRVEFLPEAWLGQLKQGGRMGVVVGCARRAQARIYTAGAGGASFRNVFECVPPALPEIRSEPVFEF